MSFVLRLSYRLKITFKSDKQTYFQNDRLRVEINNAYRVPGFKLPKAEYLWFLLVFWITVQSRLDKVTVYKTDSV